MEDVGGGYRTGARLLHWSAAVLVLAMIPAGLVMTMPGIPRGLQDALFIAHKNAGVVLLALMLVRLAYRLRHRPPPLPAALMPPAERRLASATHILLYVAVLVMAASGFVRVQAGGFPVEVLDAAGLPPLVPRSDSVANAAKSIHFAAHYAVIALVALHVAGALRHAVWRRDGLVRRMWPPIAR